MTAVVIAAVLSVVPTPADSLTAFADLLAPVGTPPAADASPRSRLAAVTALHQLGGLDAGAPDFRWFAAGIGWQTETDHARRVVARARAAPADDWIPPAEWFRAESAVYAGAARLWRARAEEYRGRADWEPDRAEALTSWAMWMDAQACRISLHATLLHEWGSPAWQRPRRVVLADVREWLGETAWANRQWPE